MNKAKALFTAAIIVIVSGASAVCWYLNENGIIGNDGGDMTAPDGYVAEYDEKNDINANVDNADGADNEEKQESKTEKTTAASDEDDAKDENAENNKSDNSVQKIENADEINEFLSIFSRLYFSEDKSYSKNSADTYELLKFAYLYQVVYGGGKGTVTEYFDDDIGAYNGIQADTAEKIIDKYFGVGISRESVYTEKTYSFFKYIDGYFYTPAADGVGYSDLVIVDSAVKRGNTVAVEFTVYSDGVSLGMTADEARKKGEKYADGRAEIDVSDGGYVLTYYSVKK